MNWLHGQSFSNLGCLLWRLTNATFLRRFQGALRNVKNSFEIVLEKAHEATFLHHFHSNFGSEMSNLRFRAFLGNINFFGQKNVAGQVVNAGFRENKLRFKEIEK